MPVLTIILSLLVFVVVVLLKFLSKRSDGDKRTSFIDIVIDEIDGGEGKSIYDDDYGRPGHVPVYHVAGMVLPFGGLCEFDPEENGMEILHPYGKVCLSAANMLDAHLSEEAQVGTGYDYSKGVSEIRDFPDEKWGREVGTRNGKPAKRERHLFVCYLNEVKQKRIGEFAFVDDNDNAESIWRALNQKPVEEAPAKAVAVKTKEPAPEAATFQKRTGSVDAFGYDQDGFDESELDRDGYDRNGYDEEGYDRQGNRRV